MTAASLTAARSFVATPVRPIGSVEGQRAFAFRHAGKRFGDKTVLDGIDLDVPAGQFLAVIGKSGCGKSTLLRLLAGLDRPTSGSLTFGLEEEGHSRTRFMFQEPRLLPWASVVKNVEVGLTGIASGVEARHRALDILGEVGLADRANEWPSVLSGGQKQRVALARALVGHPQILALDEPLGALDALTRIEMQQLLERIWIAQKFTAVLVTHDVAEAVALADRVVVISEGRIALDLDVPVERPRRRGSVELARLEGKILDRLFG
ncbi:ATP-binding cassette domain-containing protein [Mesorhizobium sp. M7A.F.Ca.US.006.01.1.1]|uniref:ATP-binding cassette domain-containing protein n=1 Tax=Mesorhizobium sp. M7A.F.Ca.US.006.01.1.1 TaxID=2496707 RepID=UPI000FCCD9D7|nr:ATP-binding cassette domain-containing protein [Mesorhizobium sp. M7A.F.Ca.US.006.01.1.1]RUZ75968.1 ATP-binding cassette domain-containing protein [Mesorhizobium sp. M7A.F.Ca.US.006.01.1.1]